MAFPRWCTILQVHSINNFHEQMPKNTTIFIKIHRGRHRVTASNGDTVRWFTWQKNPDSWKMHFWAKSGGTLRSVVLVPHPRFFSKISEMCFCSKYLENNRKRIKQHNSNFLICSLYGRWEALVVGKRLPQGPLTIPTPGKPNSEKWFVGIFVRFLPFGFTHEIWH